MKSVFPFVFATVVLFGCFLLPKASAAQVSIAVVDVEYVLSESKAAQALQKKRETAREAFLSSLRDKEQGLRKEAEDLLEKRQDMGEDAFAKAEKAYQEKVQELGRLTQKQRREFEKASSQSLTVLRDHLSSVVKDVAKEQGYQLVISNRDVITGESSLDITESVLKEMNEENLEIPFTFQQ